MKPNSKAKAFKKYFFEDLLKSTEERNFLKYLLSKSDVYIFGGIIRDYFLYDTPVKPRDIDLVISNFKDDIRIFITPYIIKENQFGGFRLKISNNFYDIWPVEKTWTYRNNFRLEFDLNSYLPATSFFNLTAAVFSLKLQKFYYKESFTKALETKLLDIVNSENPFPELCIVKSFEYKTKFNMRLSKTLKIYINTYYPKVKHSIVDVQKKHYGTIIFEPEKIDDFVLQIQKNLEQYEQKQLITFQKKKMK